MTEIMMKLIIIIAHLTRPKPLALYVFTRKSKVANAFVDRTQSGAVMVNDTVFHVGGKAREFHKFFCSW